MNLGPRPSLAAARFRAESLRKLREFFFQRNVLEVETPILSGGISLDCHIDVFSTEFYPLGFPRSGSSPRQYFLQSSPEPHMKRLLCQDFPDIYQVTKAFRNGEQGVHHNPEFTMLEWYRKGFSLGQLMDEVEALCHLLAGPRPVVRQTYQQAFQEVLELDPLDFDLDGLGSRPLLKDKLPEGHSFQTKAEALDYLMAHLVEPSFSPAQLTLIHSFPAEMAAQAQLLPEDSRLANRFEVYGGGMELGNAYLELVEPKEYEVRFDQENTKRQRAGKPQLPKDRLLLRELKRGLPPCAGIAMGFDRILLLAQTSTGIDSVLNFPWEIC